MATKKHNGEGEPAGYAEAMAEVEDILRELDSAQVDVDVLSSKVARASYLIEWCNERITAAELVVENLVAGLAGGDGAEEDDAGDEDE
jgi:exodeoxyribonuclease VII small subunit